MQPTVLNTEGVRVRLCVCASSPVGKSDAPRVGSTAAAFRQSPNLAIGGRFVLRTHTVGARAPNTDGLRVIASATTAPLPCS